MQTHQPQQTVIILSALLLLLSSCSLSVAPSGQLISFWNASNESNPAKIEHSAWQAILDAYLDANHPSGINRFDYGSLKANSTDNQKLKDYLSSLKKLDPRTYSKAEQKAYWINLYNALTVHLVVNHYPVKSIKHIDSPLGLGGPWDKKLLKIQEHRLTLNNIEHGILRPIWNDNRIHYAVNCASIGCPNLASEAYTAENMEIVLDKGAKDYVNHTRGVQFHPDGRLLVSSIYEWYKVDFGGTDASVIAHLQKYANHDLANRLQSYKGSIDDQYNWELNKP